MNKERMELKSLWACVGQITHISQQTNFREESSQANTNKSQELFETLLICYFLAKT